MADKTSSYNQTYYSSVKLPDRMNKKIARQWAELRKLKTTIRQLKKLEHRLGPIRLVAPKEAGQERRYLLKLTSNEAKRILSYVSRDNRIKAFPGISQKKKT